jgi:Tol biopolymer transport system component
MAPSGKLVYVAGSTVEAENTQLVWMSRAGGPTPVDSSWAFDVVVGNFAWALSPDGARIALRQRTSDGNQDIWIKELPAGPLRRLTFDANEQRVPFWTPDGTRVTYFARPKPGRAPETSGGVVLTELASRS